MKALRISPAHRALLKPSLTSPSPFTHHQTRAFLPFASTLNPLSSSSTPPIQHLTASRTLPYPSSSIYTIIADVSSYSAFLPFCTRSTVTAWSAPTQPGNQKWPSEAELEVGWKGVTERFTSRIYCVPGEVVEAVGGGTETKLPRESIAHHLRAQGGSGAATGGRSLAQGGGVLSHLLTRWTVRDAAAAVDKTSGQHKTHVDLAIEYQFSNPVYSAMSSAVADKVAGYMIEAFEKRVEELLAAERRRL